MPRPCLVCNSPARAAIEALILAGERHTEIGRQFGIERRSITRHKANHMDKAIAYHQNDEIEPLGASGTVEERLDALLRKAEHLLMKAERGSSLDTQIRALAECRKQVELLAKVIGDIRSDVTVQILQVIVPDERA